MGAALLDYLQFLLLHSYDNVIIMGLFFTFFIVTLIILFSNARLTIIFLINSCWGTTPLCRGASTDRDQHTPD